jgi:hypothetical protein
LTEKYSKEDLSADAQEGYEKKRDSDGNGGTRG